MTLKRKRVGLCDKLIDEHGRVVAKFDLSELDLSPLLANAFLRAHAAEYGHTSIESQKQTHRCIRKLVLCLQEKKIHRSLPLPNSIATIFHDWIARTGLKGSTAQSHQNIVLTILRWCARNIHGLIESNACITVAGFVRDMPPKHRKLDTSVTRAVLAACYEDITAVESRIQNGRKLFQQGNVVDATPNILRTTIDDLLAIGGGLIPTASIVNRSKLALAARVRRLGGLVHLKRLLYASIEDVFPFYLAVVIQTGGNPMAIRLMGVDCISPHPLRDDLECVTWEKPRSNGEQRVDFPTGKEWSAPNLIRRLMTLNSNIRSYSHPSQRQLVFIAFGLRNGMPEIPSVQSFHNYLALFARRHGLPEFDFKDWRAVSAWAHYRSAGNWDAPRRRLNHADVRTTARYVDTDLLLPMHYKVIAEFQGQLVNGAFERQRGSTSDVDTGSNTVVAPTVFGFICRDPFSGLDGISPIGLRCMNFTRCSTCPGSLVPLDDVQAISRILAAKLAIEQFRDDVQLRGSMERYRMLYADTLDIINHTILPAISAPVLEQAKLRLADNRIPNLE